MLGIHRKLVQCSSCGMTERFVTLGKPKTWTCANQKCKTVNKFNGHIKLPIINGSDYRVTQPFATFSARESMSVVIPKKRIAGHCAFCDTDFGDIEEHLEFSGHKNAVKKESHIHTPLPGSFEINPQNVICSKCGKKIDGLRRIGGHGSEISHSTHRETGAAIV